MRKCVFFVALLFALVGCAGRDQLGMVGFAEPVEQALFGDPYVLRFETSVSLLPLGRVFADGHYSEANVTAVGRDVAIESIAEGRGDIALFSGSLPTGIENVRAIVIGAEVLHLVIGLDSLRHEISLDEIYALFVDDGFFDDWDEWDDWDDDWYDEDWDDSDWDDWDDYEWDDWLDDFAMPTEDIALTLAGLHSRMLFEELFHLRDSVGGVMQSLIPESANQFGSDSEVLEFVRQHGETIGVVIAASPPSGVRSLSVDGISPGDVGYMGQQEVILAYRVDNPAAAAFVAALETGAFDNIFADNGVARG